ncbi:hypothetical protein ACFX12_012542 [Malus domestica]
MLGSKAESRQEVMYMMANYDHVVGSADSESCPSQELSIFLLQSRHSWGWSTPAGFQTAEQRKGEKRKADVCHMLEK